MPVPLAPGVGVVALPRADLAAHAVLDAFVAQVGAPRPHGDGDVHGAGQRVEPHLPVAQVDDRPDVALLEAVDPDGVLDRVDELGGRERDVDQEDLGAGEHAVDVVREPEHGCAARRRIGADALEHAAAVVQRVREDVDLGVVPVDELAIHPDLLDLVERHWVLPLMSPVYDGDRLLRSRSADRLRLDCLPAVRPVGAIAHRPHKLGRRRGRRSLTWCRRRRPPPGTPW